MDDNDEEESGNLGVNKLNSKNQVRVTDEAQEVMDVTEDDLIGFKNCPEENAVKIKKAEADF